MAKKSEQPPIAQAKVAPPSAPPEPAKVNNDEEKNLVVQPAGGELQDQTLDEMLMQDAGAGLKGLGANDFAIPFLAILQKGSPQVSKANSKYVKDAQIGMVMNTVTLELYDGDLGIIFIPCAYNKMVVEWKPRDSGGGFVAQHKDGDQLVQRSTRNERGQLVAPETGNILIDTAYHYGLHLHEDGRLEWAVVSMYSTQLKKSRVWNTMMRNIVVKGPKGPFNPPSFSHMYRLTTVGETKDTYDWMGWRIISEGRITDVDVYKAAREFSLAVEKGNVRVTAPPQEASDTQEEVPF